VDEDLFDRCAAAIAARRTSPAGSPIHREWSHLDGKVRCARCGKVMGIRFRCRTASPGHPSRPELQGTVGGIATPRECL
jgi:hypothetical protein